MNAKSLPFHRQLVAGWHLLLLAVLVFAFFAWRGDGDLHWLWIPLFATPLLVLFATFSNMQESHRSIAYWFLAATCIPTAAAGITSITGLMFVVSLIMLIWAARRENPAEEIVQM